jgi:hypothetical protein
MNLQKVQSFFHLPEFRPEIGVKLMDQLIAEFSIKPDSLKKRALTDFEMRESASVLDGVLSSADSSASFKCNRDLVANQGSYFRLAFARLGETLVLPESSERVWLLLTALYDVEMISMANVLDFLELALKYDLSKLKDRALFFLQTNKIETDETWKTWSRDVRVAFLSKILSFLDRIRVPLILV